MKTQSTKEKPDARTKLLLLQSGICLIMILLALLLKFSGGSVFDELKNNFRTAIEQDSLLSEIQKNTTVVTTTTTLTLPTATKPTTVATAPGND